MRWLKYLLGVLILIYLILCGALYFNQEKLLFNPEELSEQHHFGEGQEVEIPIDGGITMNCLWIRQPNSKGVLMYLHSNRGSIRFAQYQTKDLRGMGYDIFIPEYRGYGKTGGDIQSEEELFRDVQAAYDFVKKRYSEDKIVLMGYSLGTGFATYLAAKNNPQHLALVAPFTSMNAVKNTFLPFVPGFLLKYKLDNAKHMEEVKCGITLFHGTTDEVIKPEFSKELVAVHPNRSKLYLSKGKNHRRIIFDRTIPQAMRKVFQ